MGKFQRITSPLQKILGRYHLETAYQEKLIITSWKEFVDEKIASVVEPVSFENGILLLHAQSMMWREELTNNKDNLLKMINKSFSQITIEDIKLV